MIDCEKVIKGLKCCFRSIDKACPMECPYRVECLMQDDEYNMYSVMSDALKLLKEQGETITSFQHTICKLHDALTVHTQPEQPQWISVNDRLPERYKKVLTYGTDYGVQENWLIRAEKGISWSMGYHITHWMPLPEPPEVKPDA